MGNESARQMQPWLSLSIADWTEIAKNSVIWGNEAAVKPIFLMAGTMVGALVGGASLAFRIWTAGGVVSVAGLFVASFLSAVQMTGCIVLFNSMATLAILTSHRKAKDQADAWLELMGAEGVEWEAALKAIARASGNGDASVDGFAKSLEWQLLMIYQAFPKLSFPLSRMSRVSRALAQGLLSLLRFKGPRALSKELSDSSAWQLFSDLFPAKAAVEERGMIGSCAGAPAQKSVPKRL